MFTVVLFMFLSDAVILVAYDVFTAVTVSTWLSAVSESHNSMSVLAEK